ncbi:glycosyltransferase [Alteromonas oceani]|uniref:Glycosyltransferase n=1 Tax=Alteromonas oceani TaxID=2071609 RepID=A0ABV7K655_9ALTE|nr:glycosyltransferase [Alteromonas oceani]
MAKVIAFVHSVSEIGGAERMSEALIDGLLTSTTYIPALLIPENGPFGDLVENKGCKVIVTQLAQPELTSPIATIRNIIRLVKVFKKHQIKLLHCADLRCARAVLPAARMANIPVLCHMHFPVRDDYVSWLFRCIPKPTAFAYCSKELKTATGDSLSSVCPKAIHQVIHNGVDIHRFLPVACHNDSPRIGIVANLQERKGHIDFLDMAKIVLAQRPETQFDIIGGDILAAPREQLLKAYAEETGVGNSVTFHGQVNNVRELLSKIDVLVCASHQEAFPVSILEAMAMQKPIVTTNVNGIPEAITNNEHGLLVEAKEPEQLAKAVLQLLDFPEKAAKLAKNARERVVNEFSFNAYLDNFTQYYSRILSPDSNKG